VPSHSSEAMHNHHQNLCRRHHRHHRHHSSSSSSSSRILSNSSSNSSRSSQVTTAGVRGATTFLWIALRAITAPTRVVTDITSSKNSSSSSSSSENNPQRYNHSTLYRYRGHRIGRRRGPNCTSKSNPNPEATTGCSARRRRRGSRSSNATKGKTISKTAAAPKHSTRLLPPRHRLTAPFHGRGKLHRGSARSGRSGRSGSS
jgi:hypothetical protein